MAALECKCGCIMSNVADPVECEYHVYSDTELFEIQENFSNIENFPFGKIRIWKCWGCGRLYWFNADNPRKIIRYVQEPFPPKDSGDLD